MRMIAVRVELLQIMKQVIRADFPASLRQCEDLVSVGFHGTGFMAVDMAGLCRHNSLISGKQRVDHHRVGLGAAADEIHRRIRTAAGCPDFFACGCTVFVFPIANLLNQVGFNQSFQNPGMRPFQIITFKMQHRSILPSLVLQNIIVHIRRAGVKPFPMRPGMF